MRPRELVLLLAAWAAGAGGILALMRGPEKAYLDLDEVYWIGSSYYYDLAFARRDWTHPDWSLLPARENPPVAKYAIGAVLSATGQPVTTVDTLSYFYFRWEKTPGAWGTDEADVAKRARVVAAASPGFRAWVRDSGRIPLTPRMTRDARRLMAGCAAAASLLLLVIGTLVAGWPAGLLASLLLLLHPVVVSAYGQATSDAVALMFSTAAALAGLCWYRRFSPAPPPRLREGLPLTLLTGLLLALACGAKMNSLVVLGLAGVLTALAGLHAWVRADRAGAFRTAAHGLAILAVCVGVFTAINPAILRDFPAGLAATALECRRAELIQAVFLGGHLETLPAKLNAVAVMACFGWVPFLALAALTAGCAVKYRHDPGIRFAVCWWLTALVLVAGWLPFSWPRYILPLLPPSLLIIGCAFTRVLPGRGPGNPIPPAGNRSAI